MPANQSGPTEQRCTCETLWEESASDRNSYTQTLQTHVLCCSHSYMGRAFVQKGLHLGKQGLSACRCLLKQGEPKHNQTQVREPGPLISVTALVPSMRGSSTGSRKWMVTHFMALSICHSLSSLWPFSATVKKKLFTRTEQYTIEVLNLVQESSLFELPLLFSFKCLSYCIAFTGKVKYTVKYDFCQVHERNHQKLPQSTTAVKSEF